MRADDSVDSTRGVGTQLVELCRVLVDEQLLPAARLAEPSNSAEGLPVERQPAQVFVRERGHRFRRYGMTGSQSR
jgi:hypothetical protein